MGLGVTGVAAERSEFLRLEWGFAECVLSAVADFTKPSCERMKKLVLQSDIIPTDDTFRPFRIL